MMQNQDKFLDKGDFNEQECQTQAEKIHEYAQMASRSRLDAQLAFPKPQRQRYQ